MPETFTDNTIDYIYDTWKKRINADIEYGQVFNYKTGTPIGESIEGEKDGVLISPPDTLESNLAIQHNHTTIAFAAPSGEDFSMVMYQTWNDYSVVISQKEIWVIEAQGHFDHEMQSQIERDINVGLFNIVYDYKNKKFDNRESKLDAVNMEASTFIKKYISDNYKNKIKVHQVKL